MATTTTRAASFDALDKWMGAKYDRPYAHNTRCERRGDDAIAIRLHRTDVVTFYRDGRVRVNTGGWATPTTFDRIRGALPDVRITEGRYLHAGRHWPTNDAERAQALDGRDATYRKLDVTFHPDELPAITPTGRSLTMRPCGEGRHQGEARIGRWDSGTVLHYAAVKEGKAWMVYRSDDADSVGVQVGSCPTLKDAKRQAWEDAHRLGYDA